MGGSKNGSKLDRPVVAAALRWSQVPGLSPCTQKQRASQWALNNHHKVLYAFTDKITLLHKTACVPIFHSQAVNCVQGQDCERAEHCPPEVNLLLNILLLLHFSFEQQRADINYYVTHNIEFYSLFQSFKPYFRPQTLPWFLEKRELHRQPTTSILTMLFAKAIELQF